MIVTQKFEVSTNGQGDARDITENVAAAVAAACDLDEREVNPVLQRSQDEKFGDYQSNCAMGLAKKLGTKPRDLAQRIIDKLDIEDVCETPEIAGPGFINLRLKRAFMAARLGETPPPPAGVEPGMTIQEMEKDLILGTLGRVKGNRQQAAGMLKIGVRTLQRKILRYGIDPRHGK